MHNFDWRGKGEPAPLAPIVQESTELQISFKERSKTSWGPTGREIRGELTLEKAYNILLMARWPSDCFQVSDLNALYQRMPGLKEWYGIIDHHPSVSQNTPSRTSLHRSGDVTPLRKPHDWFPLPQRAQKNEWCIVSAQELGNGEVSVNRSRLRKITMARGL